MFAARPKPQDDLDRLQAEFLESRSRASASVVRTHKKSETEEVQVNDRVTLDAVEEEGDDEEEDGGHDEDAAARLDAYEQQALPSVVARVVEREISNSVAPFLSFPTSGFPDSGRIAQVAPAEGKKSLFAQNLLRKRQANQPQPPPPLVQPQSIPVAQSLPPVPSAQSPPAAISSSGGLQSAKILEALSASDQRAIQESNQRALDGMSDAQVLEAQREIESLLSPQLIALLRAKQAKPQQAKVESLPPEPQRKRNPEGETAGGQALDSSQRVARGGAEPETLPADLLQEYLDSKPQPEEGLTEEEWSQLGEQKEEWMKPLTTEEAQHKDSGWEHWRVDFEGVPVHGQDIPLHKGLHHHGEEPGVAGYSLSELALLCRSTVPAQRTVAFGTVARVLERAQQRLYVEKRPEDPDSLIRNVILAGFSPELRMGVGPINYSLALVDHLLSLNLALIVRSGIDDSNINTLRAAMEALRALMHVEWCGDRSWDVTRGYELTFSNEERKEQVPSEMNKISRSDLIPSLLQTQLLTRLRFLLECVEDVAVHQSALDCLVAVARHSPQAAETVFKTPRIPLVISKYVMRIVSSRPVNQGSMTVHRPMILGESLLSLLRLLCQSSRHICAHFVDSGLMFQLKRLIVTAIGLPEAVLSLPTTTTSSDIVLSLCALRCWRVSLVYHLETPFFADNFAVLCKAATLEVSSENPNSRLLQLHKRAVYNVLDLAGTLASITVGGGDIGWSQIATSVEHALAVLTALLDRQVNDDENWLVLGGVLRLLGTYFTHLPSQPEFDVAHTKAQASALLKRWFSVTPKAISALRNTALFSSDETSCLFCSSTCPRRPVQEATYDVLYNYYRFLHALLRLPEIGSWEGKLAAELFSVQFKHETMSKLEALFAFELCGVLDLVGVPSTALRFRVVPFLIAHGNALLANTVLSSIALLPSTKAYNQNSVTVIHWLQDQIQQDDIVHSKALYDLQGVTTLFVREPTTSLRNNPYYLFWPIEQLIQVESTSTKVEQVALYLDFLRGFDLQSLASSPLWTAALLKTLMRVYEMGSAVFVDVEPQLTKLLQPLLHPANVRLARLGASPRYDFDALQPRFYPIFENLVAVYAQDSWGDSTFGECILLLLTMAYAPAYRQLIWSELQAVFRILPTSLPLHEGDYFYPLETDINVLRLYEAGLCGRQRLPPFFHRLALHHFSAHLLASSKVAMEAFRTTNPSLWTEIAAYRAPEFASVSVSTSSALTKKSGATTTCPCCTKFVVWQDEGVWGCWYCDRTNRTPWRCSTCNSTQK